jgi:hypothetical protein
MSIGAVIIGQGGRGSGGGSGSNASVGLTGATAPTSATEIGIIVGGNLVGVSTSNPIPVSGAGGTQYTDGTAESSGAFQITVAGLYNGTQVQGLRGDASNNLFVNLATAVPAGANLIGQVEVSDGTNVLGTSTHPIRIDPTGTTAQPVLITGHAGATLDGTAGAPSAGVLTVQGVSGGTAVPISGTIAVSSNASDNITQWGGASVSAANTSAAGTETAPVVRPVPRKNCAILTTTPLAANGVFTSAWFDTSVTGDTFVFARALANVTSASSGFVIQISDDTSNAGLTQNLASTSAGANTVATVNTAIPTRYWRIVYTNGATLQTTFELTVVSGPMGTAVLGQGASVAAGVSWDLVQVAAMQLNVVGDGSTPNGLVNGSGLVAAVQTVSGYLTGSPANGANYSATRTPIIFKTVQATASGNTAVWTPTTGKKFRLMRFKIQLTANATLAAAGVLTVSFQDATTGIGVAQDFYVGQVALTAATALFTVGDESGWIDLGNGYISTAANNVLNVNLSAALASGNIRVFCCGTEE